MRLKRLGELYKELADKIENVDFCIRTEEKIKEEERELYGGGRELSIDQVTLKLFDNYNEMAYTLSRGGNETLESIQKMTLSQRLILQKYYLKEAKELEKRNGKRRGDI